MKRRVERGRRSAKQTIADFADELLRRPNCEETQAKLLALQTVALRMSWTDLYNRLRYRYKAPHETEEETKEKWWQK